MPSKRVVQFNFPLPRTHAGVGLGNGMFGALVWGIERLHITINRSDFWDHRGAENLEEGMTYEKLKAAYDPADPSKAQAIFNERRRPPPPGIRYPSRLPMGRFELVLREGKPTRGTLDAENGVLTVHIARKGRAGKLSFAVHPTKPLLWIGDPGRMIVRTHPRPAWEWMEKEMEKILFSPPRPVKDQNAVGWIQECPADPAMAAVAAPSKGGLLIGMGPGATAEAALSAILSEARGVVSGKMFMAETRAWWRAYWKDKPVLEIPSPFFSAFMDYTLFRFGGATNPGGALPCALQGPWVEEYQFPPWSGDYTINENIQQIYTLAFPCGAVKHLHPLFDWLDSLRNLMRRNAKIMFGIEDGLHLTHSVDDRGAALQGGLGIMGALDQGCLGWLARLYWLYYRYTGDRQFLSRRAMPFMKGVMRVYETMLEPDGDRLALELSVSPEFGHPLPCVETDQYYARLINGGRNASFQLACIHMLADMLLEAAAALGEAPKEIWKAIKAKTPLYSLIGSEHNRRIAVWEGQDLTVPHRHHSHLAAIYPFDTLGKLTPEQQAVVGNSIDHWINMGLSDASEWSLPWSAILLARTGQVEAAYLHLKIWKEIFVNEGLASVYIPRHWGITHHARKRVFNDGLRLDSFWSNMERAGRKPEDCEIMQLDGAMGAATAIYEMFVRLRGDVVQVFSAVPAEWKDAAFKNLRAPGGFIINGRKKDGAVREIMIHSLRGGTLEVETPGLERMRLSMGKKKRIVSLPCKIRLARGMRAFLSAC